MAGFVRWTGIPLPWSELLWQFLSILTILVGSQSICRFLFKWESARWGGVALLAAMLTLPVAGTALYIADQHLHPRNVSTALSLMGVSCIMTGKRWKAIPPLVLSLAVHPIMGALGASLCLFLVAARAEFFWVWSESMRDVVAAAIPLRRVLDPPSPGWRHAMSTGAYFFLERWTWYEWLGAIGPLVLFWRLKHLARRLGNDRLEEFSLAVLAFGLFQLTVAILTLGTPALERFKQLQPMRFLQLIYVFMVLIAGCLAGRYLLKGIVWRWIVLLVLASGAMFAAQRVQFAQTDHLELPGRYSANPWMQAFSWIRINTPINAYFALDPYYLSSPGEDYHSFRALAERSQLADAIKDSSVVAQVPELSPLWEHQVDAQIGWTKFKQSDFERLKKECGVDWVLVSYPEQQGLHCIWHNAQLSVCRIP